MPESNHPRFVLKLILPPQKPADQTAAAREKAAVRQFVSRVGGLENARQALELYALLSDVEKRRPKAA